MDADRFDAVAHSLRDSPSRRAVLSLGLGSLVAALSGLTDADAKKGKGKKKRKKRKTCAQLCPENANFCASRPVASTLCIDAFFFSCEASCSTDQDCLGVTNRPYCVTSMTSRASGQTTPTTGPGRNCPAAPGPGVCGQLFPPE